MYSLLFLHWWRRSWAIQSSILSLGEKMAKYEKSSNRQKLRIVPWGWSWRVLTKNLSAQFHMVAEQSGLQILEIIEVMSHIYTHKCIVLIIMRANLIYIEKHCNSGTFASSGPVSVLKYYITLISYFLFVPKIQRFNILNISFIHRIYNRKQTIP